MIGYTMFLNFTSIPGDANGKWMNERVMDWMNQRVTLAGWTNDWMSDRLTHFGVPHHHLGVGVFPFQKHQFVQAARLQPGGPVTFETQRGRPLIFDEGLDRRQRRVTSCSVRITCLCSLCVLFTMSSGGKMTSCVGSNGAKSAARNRHDDSWTPTRGKNHMCWTEISGYNLLNLHQRLPVSSSQLRSHWPDSRRCPAPFHHSTPRPERKNTSNQMQN